MLIILSRFGSLVKFSHTVFALPFALSIAVVLSERRPISVRDLAIILGCLVLARTAAMAFNRLADHEFDTRNPRTAGRELPAGLVSRSSVIALFVLTSLGFLMGAGLLGRHCLLLAPLVLAILCLYSYTKRFTAYSHLILGLALSLAPGGVWYALAASVEMPPLLLMAAVIFWVAGFDVLYACQDVAFDRQAGLHSLAVRLGIPSALKMARLFHVAAVIFLVFFGVAVRLDLIFYLGLAAFAAALWSQHVLVRYDDLSRLDAAFFTRNGIASIVFLLGVVGDHLLRAYVGRLLS